MFPLSSNQSNSGDSYSDTLLDTPKEAGANNSKAFMAGDFALGLGSPPYISALDRDHDVFHFDLRNDSSAREIFLTSPPYGQHGYSPKLHYFQPELHPPSQSPPQIPHLRSTEAQYTSRFNHHTHNTLPLLPQLITEDLESLVDTSMLMTSNIGYATEPVSATTTPSCGDSPQAIEHSQRRRVILACLV